MLNTFFIFYYMFMVVSVWRYSPNQLSDPDPWGVIINWLRIATKQHYTIRLTALQSLSFCTKKKKLLRFYWVDDFTALDSEKPKNC